MTFVLVAALVLLAYTYVGYPVALRDYFHKGRPVLLNLIYYSCPMLCNLILNGQVATLREIPWTPGNEFEIVTISIDPSEAFDLARKKKLVYLGSYDRPAPGWHFLTDHDNNAKKLSEQMGFKYRYDESQGQYAHAAAIFVLTPEGKISRYLYGARYRSRDANPFGERLLAALRNQFGGHAVTAAAGSVERGADAPGADVPGEHGQPAASR